MKLRVDVLKVKFNGNFGKSNSWSYARREKHKSEIHKWMEDLGCGLG